MSWSVCVQAGAEVLDNLGNSGNLSLPLVTALPPVEWASEVGFIAADPIFAAVAISPKRVTGTIRCSRQLLLQVGRSLDALLINDLSRACSSQLDQMCFYGNSTTNVNQPNGILNTPGIHRITTSGADIFSELILAESLEAENISLDTYANITSPAVRRMLRFEECWPAGGLSVWNALTNPRSSMVLTDDTIFFGSFQFMTIAILAVDVVINPFAQAAAAQPKSMRTALSLICRDLLLSK